MQGGVIAIEFIVFIQEFFFLRVSEFETLHIFEGEEAKNKGGEGMKTMQNVFQLELLDAVGFVLSAKEKLLLVACLWWFSYFNPRIPLKIL